MQLDAHLRSDAQQAPTSELAHAEPPGKMRVFIDNGIFVDASTFRSAARKREGRWGGMETGCVYEGWVVIFWESSAVFLTCIFQLPNMLTED